jgi:hypothetical protein
MITQSCSTNYVFNLVQISLLSFVLFSNYIGIRDSVAVAFPDSIAVAFPDSIAVAFPDSIAVAFLRHAHQYHRDRLFVMHINISGTGSSSCTSISSGQALCHAHQYHRDRLYVMHINIIGTGLTTLKL